MRDRLEQLPQQVKDTASQKVFSKAKKTSTQKIG
jgi:hypothetical protein